MHYRFFLIAGIIACAGSYENEFNADNQHGANSEGTPTAGDTDSGDDDTLTNVIEVSSIDAPTIWESRYIYVITTNCLYVEDNLTSARNVIYCARIFDS